MLREGARIWPWVPLPHPCPSFLPPPEGTAESPRTRDSRRAAVHPVLVPVRQDGDGHRLRKEDGHVMNF